MSIHPAQTRKPSDGIDQSHDRLFMASEVKTGKDVAAAWAVVAGIFVLLFLLF